MSSSTATSSAAWAATRKTGTDELHVDRAREERCCRNGKPQSNGWSALYTNQFCASPTRTMPRWSVAIDPSHDGRVLRVVVNTSVEPARVVSALTGG
jgi:hypothetical protein